MKKDELVVKHNSLIRSRYDYTIAELRLVITIASMIDADDEDFREYTVAAKEYAELMGADAHNVRKAVKELGQMLLSKPLQIPTTGGFALANWFSWFEYKDGMIHCSFHPKLKPYMLQLKEMFTKYSLENILKFKSAYSIRIYEIAKSWEARGEFVYPVNDFKELIGAVGKYSAYYDFKRYVLERSLKEINSLSDIHISFKEKKLGRKVTDLVFTVKPNLPKEKNFLTNKRAFVAYMRKKFVNKTLYAGAAKKDDGTPTKVEIAISPDGRLYDKLSTNDFTWDKADALWSWLFDLAKQGELTVLN